ncbi:hypothetical protein BDW22DRAFT_1482798 [Trametopsis cervina]|nr:hypothetical protein BDW22DRAFT_1482798 [Trametopsis cervina]
MPGVAPEAGLSRGPKRRNVRSDTDNDIEEADDEIKLEDISPGTRLRRESKGKRMVNREKERAVEKTASPASLKETSCTSSSTLDVASFVAAFQALSPEARKAFLRTITQAAPEPSVWRTAPALPMGGTAGEKLGLATTGNLLRDVVEAPLASARG